MRSLMLAAALALTSLVAQPDADACGGSYGPSAPLLFLVSSHHDGVHTFVMGNPVDDAGHTWRRLEEMSYDHTVVAPAPALAGPVKLTLLGPAGAKVVSSQKQLFVKEGFGRDRTPWIAMQVPGGDFRIAVYGAHTDYAWHELEYVGTTGPATKARVGETELITTYSEATATYETQVKQHGSWFGTASGRAFGVITAGGKSYAVIRDGNTLSTISLPATATPRA